MINIIIPLAFSILFFLRGIDAAKELGITGSAGKVLKLIFSKWVCVGAMATITFFLLPPLDGWSIAIESVKLGVGFALFFGMGWMLAPAVYGNPQPIIDGKDRHWLIDFWLIPLRKKILTEQDTKRKYQLSYLYGTLWLSLRGLYALPLGYVLSGVEGLLWASLMALMGLITFLTGRFCAMFGGTPQHARYGWMIAMPIIGGMLGFIITRLV